MKRGNGDNGRRVWSEEEAREVLEELRLSGEATTEFARRKGVTPQRLWWWKKRLVKSDGGVPAFLPIAVRAVEMETAVTVEIGGAAVVLRRLDEASARWVAVLVRSLGDPS